MRVEDTVRTDSTDLHALQLQVRALQEKAIYTENRLRRNNVQILGLPECAEGPRRNLLKPFWRNCSFCKTSVLGLWWRELTRYPPLRRYPGLRLFYCDCRTIEIETGSWRLPGISLISNMRTPKSCFSQIILLKFRIVEDPLLMSAGVCGKTVSSSACYTPICF